MTIRDAKTPGPAELDRLAEITAEDVADARRTLGPRVPEASRVLDSDASDESLRIVGATSYR